MKEQEQEEKKARRKLAQGNSRISRISRIWRNEFEFQEFGNFKEFGGNRLASRENQEIASSE